MLTSTTKNGAAKLFPIREIPLKCGQKILQNHEPAKM